MDNGTAKSGLGQGILEELRQRAPVSERGKPDSTSTSVRRERREEKETIINFNEGESMVNVFTYNKRWQRRIREMGIKPIRTEGQAKEYEFPKKWLRLPVKPRNC